MGDECCVFEQYIPSPNTTLHSGNLSTGWYRGDVLSMLHSSLLNLPSSAQLDQYAENDSLIPYPQLNRSNLVSPEESQVSLGIFPAVHLRIREPLNDSSQWVPSLQISILRFWLSAEPMLNQYLDLVWSEVIVQRPVLWIHYCGTGQNRSDRVNDSKTCQSAWVSANQSYSPPREITSTTSITESWGQNGLGEGWWMRLLVL